MAPLPFLLRSDRCDAGGNPASPHNRRGSLPLKKRKLSFPSSSSDATTLSASSLSSLVATAASLPPLPDLLSPATTTTTSVAAGLTAPTSSVVGLYSPPPPLPLGNDEHLAALALLSAAASRGLAASASNATAAAAFSPRDFPPQGVPLLPLLPSVALQEGDFCPPGISLGESAGRKNQDPSSSPSPPPPPVASLKARIFKRQGRSEDERSSELLPQHYNQQRAGVPPSSSTAAMAASPLPGMCHGLSSRTGTFCRKPASYKGSSYCKQHYDLYLGGGAVGSISRSTTTSSSSSKVAERELATSTQRSSLATAVDPGDGAHFSSSQISPQQDRRYAGAPGEQRCQATTTRGRPCAYAAALGASGEDGLSFCHMHAVTHSKGSQSHGNHLSRRVSSLSSSWEGTEAAVARASPASAPKPLKPAASTFSAGLQPLQPPLKSEKSSSFSRRRAKHSDSPDPLLSKVPVDDWFGKAVRIACGPLEGKVGTVQRWGNGWITVLVPGVGLHNRRSFELCVVVHTGDDSSGGTDGRGGTVMSSPASLSSSSITEMNRSTVSPSPSSEDSRSTTVATSKGPDGIVHKVSYSYDGEEATPRPREPASVLVVDATPQLNERSLVASTAVSVAAGRYPGQHQQEILEAHKITPVSPRKAMTEIPLAKSVALAREGGARKYRIDMLFGTAALERGRRSVHLRISPPSSHRSDDPVSAEEANDDTAEGG